MLKYQFEHVIFRVRIETLQFINNIILHLDVLACFFQDLFTELWSPSSSKQKGTLFNLRNRLNMTNVTGDVPHTFAHSSDLIEVVTICYTILAAKHIISLRPTPDFFNFRFLQEISKSVVELCFEVPNIQLAAQEEECREDYPYCECGEELGGMMVCCSNWNCLHGKWFHPRCINLQAKDIPKGDWFCRPSCEREALGGNTASQRKKPKNKTSVLSSSQVPTTDSKLEYSRGLLFRGLLQQAIRDAVRENDGPRILTHWKFLMPHFYQWGHPKYFILGTRLLLSVAGAISKRLAFQLTWTRTVNATGGAGRNIEADLQMEHFNRAYKGKVT